MQIDPMINDIQQKYPFVVSPLVIIDITPFPAPRMTRSDKWKTDPNHPDPKKRQREVVQKYFAWRDSFVWLCKQQWFFLPEVLNVVFVLPMPESWSQKKKKAMYLEPHKQRPDRDNMLKSLSDAFGVDDGYIWDGRPTKIWGTQGKIIFYT